VGNPGTDIFNTGLSFGTFDVVEFDGMVILKGNNSGTGTVADPFIRAGATLKFTGTLWAFLSKNYLYDFTITEVDGTFVSQSVTTEIAQTQLISIVATDPGNKTQGSYGPVGITGGGTGAQATVVIGNTGLATSIIVTDGGSGYSTATAITIDGADIGGITSTDDVVLNLTIPYLVPEYTKSRLNLEQIYIQAEDVDVTNNILRFKVYNTLDYSLFYKHSLTFRIFNDL